MSQLLFVVHNLKTGQDIVHEFCDSDFALELVVEGSSEPDNDGNMSLDLSTINDQISDLDV